MEQPGQELGMEKNHEGCEDVPGEQSKAWSWCSEHTWAGLTLCSPVNTHWESPPLPSQPSFSIHSLLFLFSPSFPALLFLLSIQTYTKPRLRKLRPRNAAL